MAANRTYTITRLQDIITTFATTPAILAHVQNTLEEEKHHKEREADIEGLDKVRGAFSKLKARVGVGRPKISSEEEAPDQRAPLIWKYCSDRNVTGRPV